jgi:pyruvate kinase
LTNYRRTQVIATLGPASDKGAGLSDLLDTQADFIRLNMAHHSQTYYTDIIAKIRQWKELKNTDHPKILIDLAGSKIRVQQLTSPLILEVDDDIIISKKEIDSPHKAIIVTGDFEFIRKIGEGRIFIHDGKIELETIEILTSFSLKAKVVRGGIIESRKGVNFPGVELKLIPFSEKDKSDLVFALHQGADCIAHSFVQTEKDYTIFENIMQNENIRVPILAKIETVSSVDNLEEIIKTYDGILIARGDLGVETTMEKVPLVQKKATRLATKYAKPIFIATQLLDSMRESETPTRGEINDVASAIFSGVSGLVLTDETAVGRHPAKVVKQLQRIIDTIENDIECKNI